MFGTQPNDAIENMEGKLVQITQAALWAALPTGTNWFSESLLNQPPPRQKTNQPELDTGQIEKFSVKGRLNLCVGVTCLADCGIRAIALVDFYDAGR